jgi:hypothetical protein
MPDQYRQPRERSDGMMRVGGVHGGASWLIVSGGLAVGLGSAAFGLAAQAALAQGAVAQTAMVSTLALLAPMGVAGVALLHFLRVPATPPADRDDGGAVAAAAAPSSPAGEIAGPDHRAPRQLPGPGTPGGPEPAQPAFAGPAVGFAAFPVVSVADGRPVAAVAIEPAFRDPTGRPVPAAAVDWARVPPALAARLDATLLARAAAFAAARGESGRAQTVIATVNAASLRERAFAGRLGPALDPPRSDRSRLLVLARGGADDLDGYLALPHGWRDNLGLHLTRPPEDEAALRRCLAAGLGCLELDASLLDPRAPGAALAARLVARVAATNVPVIVSGVGDDALLRRLRAQPTLFARGPLFDALPAVAA